MLKIRVIPALLLHHDGLYKTVKFKNPQYIGDPINAIKIFSDKEVDELVIIDIDATKLGKINYTFLNRINKEAFMPLGYGGGIKTVDDVKKILNIGYEKIIVNSHALENIEFITQAASECGSQSIVVCIDVKRNLLGKHEVFDYKNFRATRRNPAEYAKLAENAGAGEIILYSVDNEGTLMGYDNDIIKRVSGAVAIPVVALGGAGKLSDFKDAIGSGASAVAAGSFFVYHGPHRAVLITYPEKRDLKKLLY